MSQAPAVLSNLATGLAASVSHTPSGDGQFMKFTKFGQWLFGPDEIEVEEDTNWAINPEGFTHGWIAWGDKAHGTEGEMLGEQMCSASTPHPDQPEAVDGKWTEQRGLVMVCVDGEDKGTQVLFKANSRGGLKAYNAIVRAVVKRILARETDIVPLVTLDADSYVHKTYGKIFTPEVNIASWVAQDATSVPEAPAEETEAPAEEPAAAPARRQRRRKNA
jgi:hypothetical protein